MKKQVLALLLDAGGKYRSGEEMSAALGVSRAAVWKAVAALREAGYAISSAPNRGYRLDATPDTLDPAAISALLPTGCVVGSNLVCLSTVDSTNNECRRLAAGGAPDGTAVLAETQTGGKGRGGRSFASPPGGLYLSILLRPDIAPGEAVNMTAWVAVAVCRAVEAACGVSCAIKWTNDIILNGKKLCGILTEMGMVGETGGLDYVVTGMGINLHASLTQSSPELASKAVSLEEVLGAPPRRDALIAALLSALDDLRRGFPHTSAEYLEEYRRRCVTVGNEVAVLRSGQEPRTGIAVGIDDRFRLLVDFSSSGGGTEAIEAGEVSVRGLLGYV